MNDWVRDRLINRKGKVSFLGGAFAGACAGASNVLVISPLEMIKIRIQMAGEERRPQKIGAFKIVRSIGISGLYKVSYTSKIDHASNKKVHSSFSTIYDRVSPRLYYETFHSAPYFSQSTLT